MGGSRSRTADPETLPDGRGRQPSEPEQRVRCSRAFRSPADAFCFCEPKGGQGALPDEMYKDRGAAFVDQANTLKKIYVSSCRCVRQAHARHATTLPAGRYVDLRFRGGFDGKLGRRSQNFICRRQVLACGQPPRTASIAGCH
jgi:hypothetical protein